MWCYNMILVFRRKPLKDFFRIPPLLLLIVKLLMLQKLYIDLDDFHVIDVETLFVSYY
jgi:hypothetical protein